MTRYTRAVFPDVPLHIIQRGNNRNPCFFTRSDYQVYLALLGEHASESGCSVHAYVLMPNHVHILATPRHVGAPAAMMKRVGQAYVQFVNRRYRRSGTLWQGRYRSCLVDSERYFLICQRYIELNAVRAGMVAHPGDYEWSSYTANAHGVTNKIVVPHPIFESLAVNDDERRVNYRALFSEAIPAPLLEQVRHATNGNNVFGSERFADEVTLALGRHLSRQPSGRRPA